MYGPEVIVNLRYMIYRTFPDTLHKYRFSPCGVTAVLYIYVFFYPAGLCGVGEIYLFLVAAGHEQ
jgi:hypothetical protein